MDIYRIINWEVARKGEHFKHFLTVYFIPQTDFILEIIDQGIKAGEFETDNPMYVVLNMMYFPDIITPFWKDFVSGTKWDNFIRDHHTEDSFFNYMIRHTFKSLSPVAESANIPGVPQKIMEDINNLLENANA